MRKIKAFFVTVALLVSSVAFAQKINVKGVVSDASTGEPVPFASIQLKGTMTGASTDANGNYSISVPKEGTLVFSSIGYHSQEIAVAGQAVVNASLVADSEALDETIVVAYGVQKKSSFVGSATQISGEKLASMQTTNVGKALEGAVAGLQTASSSGTPGAGASIQIRGFGSYSLDSSPLIVLDGVPYEGGLNSISASDIESITVLKDAAANSMYGARGSNGVIIITTKRGNSSKVKLTFDAKVGVNSRGVPAYDVITNPGDYYEMAWEASRNALYFSTNYPYAQANNTASKNLVSQLGGYNIYKGIEDADLIDPSTGKLNKDAKSLKWHDNWMEDVFKPGLRQEYNLTAAGGSDKTQAFMSVSYLNDEGYTPCSGFSRISARAKVDHSINKFIKAGISMAYSNTNQQTFGSESSTAFSNLFYFSQQIAPIYPIYLYNTDTGERLYNDKGGALYDWGETGRSYAASSNPYGQLLSSKNLTTRDNLTTRGYININLAKDLVLSANIAYDVFNTKKIEYTTPAGGDAANVGGRGEQEMDRYTALNANQLLTWSPSFGKHNITALLGHETKSDESYYLYGHMTKFVDPNVVDFANSVVYQDLTSATAGYFLEGFFGRADYNYDEKYYLSASIRRDGSSYFDPSRRWGNFWAVGASWNAKAESFMQNVDWVNNLKIKASYGTQGNDGIGHIVYDNLYRIDRVDGEASLTKTWRAAKELTWEKSNNFNAGVETRLFNILSVNVDYFIKKTTDLIYAKPLAPSQGRPTSQYVNDMDMMNKGIEFEVSADIFKTRDFAWNVSFNGTHYKNTITRVPGDWPEEGKQIGNFWRENGGSLYDYYMYEWAGVNPENGLPQFNKYTKDDEGNEVVSIVNDESQATLRKTGKTPIPDLYGGFTTSVRYKGFDLSASFAYQIGGYMLDSVYQGLMDAGSLGTNWHKDIYNRWTPSNTNTDVPRVQEGYQHANATSTRFLIKSSYISLRNITLGYTLPSNLVSKIGVEGARVFVNGDNVFYASKRKGMDVRQSFSGANAATYSALRNISAGVTLTF